jgi:hypothetical protein
MTDRPEKKGSRLSSWLRRGPWENAAMGLIGLGVVMLMQPISIGLYGYSFVTILAGTLGFVIVSHFPE